MSFDLNKINPEDYQTEMVISNFVKNTRHLPFLFNQLLLDNLKLLRLTKDERYKLILSESINYFNENNEHKVVEEFEELLDLTQEKYKIDSELEKFTTKWIDLIEKKLESF